MKLFKIIGFPLAITGFALGCMILLFFAEEIWVYNMVNPLSGTIEQWIPEFKKYAIYGIIGAWLCAMIWYAAAQWGMKVNKFSEAGKRYVWWLFTVLALLPVVIFSIIQAIKSPLQEGLVFPPLIYFLNFIITFYLPTLFFSPSSFKYAPVPAKFFRRWW
ncbi:MAG: hypothetical protein GTO45_32200 [Candidatus Aminicenantes bacterium]|nr:hypothetical protein [Candidatus Aminicenantes bacterium]NIM83429.1 hypothetical protein [Candidatus Aminicenantes bacterium]NIN22804.1 hypothetical protein [Candidatus Aminicenantes bacterium]NIN46538.1 hypothetical protein [Candidatus Aminicenantes bacterium]NIN89443.1 hypothetical protein [Candidatus Aminicenantes bacterium]